MAERFVEDRNTFRAAILPGCGHWLLEECAPQVVTELVKFVGD